MTTPQGPTPRITAPQEGIAPDLEHFAFDEEREAKAQAFLKRYPAERKASAVLPLLHLVQEQHGGWLPKVTLDYVADYLGMPRIRVYEVATFYDMFNLEPTARTQIRVCTTTPCWLCGSDDVLRACKDVLGCGVGENSPDGRFYLREFECLGACANAPMMWIDQDYFEDLDYERTKAVLEALVRGEEVKAGSQTGRFGSMPVEGKTSLFEVPETAPVDSEGQIARDQDTADRARPDDAVEEHHEAVQQKGEPKPTHDDELGTAEERDRED